MADIFISYSSKDKGKADQLSELLASAGVSVWIDQQGIVGAEKWATEIVEGIKGCATFILLLSPNSVQSENVLRELSLASEKRKRVLPVDLEPIELPSSFEYPLAGLQRCAITEFDKILHAHKHGVEKVVKKDERKSLMILPFEDLSPTGDYEWLASGIVSELISALSNVKSIRIADNQATKEFKRYHGQLAEYAKEMNFRYFVIGDVRKYGEQIKINSSLLDIETGERLWQDSMKGTMVDIFDFQERVALQVVEGLKLHLTTEEKTVLESRGTENAEAYELYLKGKEYFARNTKAGTELAQQLYSEAIKLDPEYASAYASKANALAMRCLNYTPDTALLEEGQRLIEEALRLKPDLWGAYHPWTLILMLQGNHSEAEQTAKKYIQNAPGDYLSHFALAFFYGHTQQAARAIAPLQEAHALQPKKMSVLLNLVFSCNEANEYEARKHWAQVAIPHFEKHLKLFPDDENACVNRAVLLHFAGKDEEAIAAARDLHNLNDGGALYNSACLQTDLGDYEPALKTFRKAIESGYRNISDLKLFLADEDDGIGTLKGTPEWEAARKLVEKLSEP